MRMNKVLVAAVAALPAVVFAHTGHGDAAGGLAAGITHPFSGLDHLVAMLAVGIWAALLGGRARWVLPVAFPLTMVLGGLLGIAGVALPGTEIGIAVSAIVLGVLIALSARPPLGFAAALVAVFAMFHGYAHGGEIPAFASVLAYSVGFVLATVTLHAIGLAVGTAKRWPMGQTGLRFGSLAIALCGLVFLVPAVTGA